MQYTISVDWTGSNYLGLILEWDYKEGYITISIPKYVVKALQHLKHTLLVKPVHSPSIFVPPVYSTKTQYVEPKLKHTSLPSATKIFVQQVARTFLYYDRAIDNTMLVTIRDLDHQQASPTTSTIDLINHFLYYAATHPIVKLRYY